MRKIYLLLLAAIGIFSRLYAQIPPPCNMIVDFIADSSISNSPTINFTNTSTPLDAADSTTWFFGDGASSTNANPSHTYTNGGIYTVCLRVTKNNASQVCRSEYCREVYVPIDCGSTPDFDFERNRDSNNNSFTFWVTALYTQYDSFIWDFGDGSPVITMPNYSQVTHMFPSTGTYNVCLKRTRVIPGTTTVLCETQICKPVVFNTADCNLAPNFSYNADPLNTQQFQFNNLSTPFSATDSVYWLFGDGYSSTETNPVHTYNDGGVYNVCIRVITGDVANTGASCYGDYCQQVTVPYTCNVIPSFSWTPDSFQLETGFNFFNTSRPFNSYDSCFWDFGDGTLPVYNNGVVYHEFAGAGIYNVCLTIKKMAQGNGTVICQQQSCSTVVVGSVLPCNIQASFTSQSYISGNRNIEYFTAVPVTGASYNWDFGDGNTGSGLYALHQYALPGNYTACLSISTGVNCTSSSCSTINALPNLCDTNTLSFTYNRDYYLPNKLYFFAKSFSPFYDQQWSFKKISSLPDSVYAYQTGSAFLFPDTGTYQACVTVDFQNGCSKTFCDNVVISSTAVPSYCYLLSFPNPAVNNVTVNVELDIAGPVTTAIYTLQGLAVRQSSQQGVAGNNIVSLNISSLPAGFYSIQLNYGNKVCYSRFQKI